MAAHGKIQTFILVAASFFPLTASAQDSELTVTCNQALEQGKIDTAITLASQALKKSNSDRKAYLCLGLAQGTKDDHAAAVAALQEAERLAVDPSEHIVALTLLGNQYASVGANVEAEKAYKASLSIARAGKIRHFERVNLNQLGEIRQAVADYSGALEYYLQSQKLAANDNERADGNAHIAAAYSLLGNHDKAIEYQIKSVLGEERVGELDQYANASVELGRIYVVAGQYANAEKALNKILAVVTQAGDAYWEAKIYYLFGKLRQAQGKQAEARDYFQRAKKLADQAGAEELSREIQQAMPN